MTSCLTCTCPIEGRGKKFCSSACYHKGHSLGLTSQHKATIHRRTCRFCGGQFEVKYRRKLAQNQGVYCSTTCHNKAQALGRTPKHQGGIRRQLTVFREAFAKGKVSASCLICGFSRWIEAAHIIPASLGGRYELDNLLLLCPNHHVCFDRGRLTDEEVAKLLPKAQEAYHGIARGITSPRSIEDAEVLREKMPFRVFPVEAVQSKNHFGPTTTKGTVLA